MAGLLVDSGRYAAAVLRSLHGLFAVYKPPGVPWKLVRDSVETNLLKELNSLKQKPTRNHVRFLLGGGEASGGDAQLTLSATMMPVLADHHLVKGPNYTHLKIGTGQRLDTRSSGVFVLGVGDGAKRLTEMYNGHFTKDYTVCGVFGKATDDFSDTGRLVEKTTYDHIVRDKLERILAVIQGTHQKALLAYSQVDLQSQKAYELAAKGLLRPLDKSPPLITGIRCLRFAPPEFTLGEHDESHDEDAGEEEGTQGPLEGASKPGQDITEETPTTTTTQLLPSTCTVIRLQGYNNYVTISDWGHQDLSIL